MPPWPGWFVTVRWLLGRSSPERGPIASVYVITEAGKQDVDAWLDEPIPAEPHLQTTLFAKVVLALMLGRSAEQYLDTQRAAHLQRRRELNQLKLTGNLADALLADYGLYHLEADLRWIDIAEGRLSALAKQVRP